MYTTSLYAQPFDCSPEEKASSGPALPHLQTSHASLPLFLLSIVGHTVFKRFLSLPLDESSNTILARDGCARRDPEPEWDLTGNAEWLGSSPGPSRLGESVRSAPCRQPAQKVCPFPRRSISHPQVLWKSGLVMCMWSSQFFKPQLKSIKNV